MCLSGRTAPPTSHFIILSRFFGKKTFCGITVYMLLSAPLNGYCLLKKTHTYFFQFTYVFLKNATFA